MAEAPLSRRALPGRLAFAATYLALVYIALLPIALQPPVWAGPDLLLALTLVWVMRRPDLAPLGVIAALWLLTDFMLQRPPGLMAALVVIATEALRNRNASLRAMPFFLEWLAASGAIIAVTLCYRIALALAMVPQAPLGLSLMQMVMTILAFPVFALISRLFFRVARVTPGEIDAYGKPL